MLTHRLYLSACDSGRCVGQTMKKFDIHQYCFWKMEPPVNLRGGAVQPFCSEENGLHSLKLY